jgi:hypothetical protein
MAAISSGFIMLAGENRMRRPGVGGEFGADGLQFHRVAEAVQHDVGAGLCQGGGDGEADAAGRSRDDGALSSKAHDTHLLSRH